MYMLYFRQSYVDDTAMRSDECSFRTKRYDGAYAFKVKWIILQLRLSTSKINKIRLIRRVFA